MERHYAYGPGWPVVNLTVPDPESGCTRLHKNYLVWRLYFNLGFLTFE